MKIPPPTLGTAAASTEPSVLEQIATQARVPAFVWTVQVTPESVDLYRPEPWMTAANFVPSLLEVIDLQVPPGEPDCKVQLCPEFDDV
jgi:hypothetical protein